MLFHAGIGARRGGGHVLAELAEAACVQAHLDLADVLERHHDLFERGVAGALAEAVDGGVHVGGAGLDAGQRVGRGHAEVVVRVHLQVQAHVLLEEADHVVGVEGVQDAERVAEAQAVGALVLGRLAEAQQELEVGARGVLGVHRDVQVVLLGEGHALADLVEHPLPRLLPACARCGCRWPTWRWPRRPRRSRGSAGCRRRRPGSRPGSRCPDPGRRSGVMVGLLVAAHGRDADLDLVHADLVEQLGDADLLVVAEDHAGRLLAVAQGGVVDAHRRASAGRRRAMTKLERSLVMVTCLLPCCRDPDTGEASSPVRGGRCGQISRATGRSGPRRGCDVWALFHTRVCAGQTDAGRFSLAAAPGAAARSRAPGWRGRPWPS